MKQKPRKLPFEFHDPKPPALNCGQPLDLSDQPPEPPAQSAVTQPLRRPDDGVSQMQIL